MYVTYIYYLDTDVELLDHNYIELSFFIFIMFISVNGTYLYIYFCSLISLIISVAVFCCIRISFSVPPKIEHKGQMQLKVVLGSSIDLPCRSTGVPKPRITWQKGTRILADVPGQLIHVSSISSNFGLTDKSLFSCFCLLRECAVMVVMISGVARIGWAGHFGIFR